MHKISVLDHCHWWQIHKIIFNVPIFFWWLEGILIRTDCANNENDSNRLAILSNLFNRMSRQTPQRSQIPVNSPDTILILLCFLVYMLNSNRAELPFTALLLISQTQIRISCRGKIFQARNILTLTKQKFDSCNQKKSLNQMNQYFFLHSI